MGRRPLRREKAKPPRRETLRSRADVLERGHQGKRRKGRFGERRVGSIFGGGRAQEAGSSREQEVPPRFKPSGGEKGHGFPDGRKPLERGYQADEV